MKRLMSFDDPHSFQDLLGESFSGMNANFGKPRMLELLGKRTKDGGTERNLTLTGSSEEISNESVSNS